MKKIVLVFGILVILGALMTFTSTASQAQTGTIEDLGEFLYFDEKLSDPDGQSCASCHLPEDGFDDPDDDLPVSEGVVPGLFGGRNSPASAYAMYAPIFHLDVGEGLWIGGQFWDGRATGWVLGDPLADQAVGPFLNPVEMANTSEKQVVLEVLDSDYADLFVSILGYYPVTDAEFYAAYDQIGLAIAAFERTALFGQFSSKYDAYLALCLDIGGGMNDCAKGIGKDARKAGKKIFSKEEWDGMQLFMGENNNDGILEKGEGAMCSACHVADWIDATVYGYPENTSVIIPDWTPDGWIPPVFTDFTFDNLGIPQNTEYPLDPDAEPDLGLGAVLVPENSEEYGKFKVMTLRNIGLTAPYGHNGLFKRLKDITHFYNTRDVPGALPKGMDWDPPEYPNTVNFDELGNLGLSDDDEDALVEFMKTLSDGWTP